MYDSGYDWIMQISGKKQLVIQRDVPRREILKSPQVSMAMAPGQLLSNTPPSSPLLLQAGEKGLRYSREI